MSLADAVRRIQDADAVLNASGPLPFPVLALLDLRRIRLLGADGGVDRISLEGELFEAWLRRPLEPKQIHQLAGAVPDGLEFLSGKDMGLRLRGHAGDLIGQARGLLEAPAACASVSS